MAVAVAVQKFSLAGVIDNEPPLLLSLLFPLLLFMQPWTSNGEIRTAMDFAIGKAMDCLLLGDMACSSKIGQLAMVEGKSRMWG